MDPKFDVTRLYHRCTGEDCAFCAWRAKNPISIGWESLFEDPVESSSSSHDVDKSDDELCILDEEDIKQLDRIEHELSQKQEPAAGTSKQESLDSRPGQSSGKRKYGSPKSHEKVAEAMSNGVPEKTRNQTRWAVTVWKEWAVSRNLNLLHGEAPFSCDIEQLRK